MKHKCQRKQRSENRNKPTRPASPKKPVSTLVCVCFVFDKHEKRTENKIVLDARRAERVGQHPKQNP